MIRRLATTINRSQAVSSVSSVSAKDVARFADICDPSPSTSHLPETESDLSGCQAVTTLIHMGFDRRSIGSWFGLSKAKEQEELGELKFRHAERQVTTAASVKLAFLLPQ